MKKILYSLLTFTGIGILAGILYILLTSQGNEIITSHPTITPTMPSSITQSGANPMPTLPVEMIGGVALDPYRHNSVSGEERLYKGVPIMPVVDINLDCSTADNEKNRAQCEKFKANIERTKKEREATMQQSGSTNTGSISIDIIAPLAPF